jgi:hypothetical protein
MGAATLRWNTPFAVPLTVLLLSFMMGLQNAVGSKTSGGSMRTTHMTGNITDLGMELGKLLLWQRRASAQPVPHHWPRMKASAGLLAMFVLGGMAGHWVFSTWALSAWCRWPPCCWPWPCLRCCAICRAPAARPAQPPRGRAHRRWRLSNKPDRAQDVQ